MRWWLPDHPRDYRVGRPWHDAAADLRDVVMVCRRATFYGVIPGEGRISIASHSSNRSGPNARRHAASEIEMHRERAVSVAVDQLNMRSRCRQHCRSGSDRSSVD